MGKPLAYLATAVVAFIASPFVALAALLIPTLVLFLLLSLFGIATVAAAFLIPIILSGAAIFGAVILLVRLLR
jgi:hypothetical protein